MRKKLLCGLFIGLSFLSLLLFGGYKIYYDYEKEYISIPKYTILCKDYNSIREYFANLKIGNSDYLHFMIRSRECQFTKFDENKVEITDRRGEYIEIDDFFWTHEKLIIK